MIVYRSVSRPSAVYGENQAKQADSSRFQYSRATVQAGLRWSGPQASRPDCDRCHHARTRQATEGDQDEDDDFLEDCGCQNRPTRQATFNLPAMLQSFAVRRGGWCS